nr:KrmL [uncultured bacterium]
MGFWAKSLMVFNCFYHDSKPSIRDVAQQTGLSKSSVHRLKQAILRRDQHPESWFWETREGQQWLIRLVVATLYTFGLKRGVGAETLSEFLLRLGLQSQIGCSPSALRHLMQLLEQAIVETTQEWEREGVTQGQIGPIIGAVDETFLQCMMLVFMDLSSGYLLFEETAQDRTYDTWYARVTARLETLGTRVLYLVSDRAKPLVKLGKTGLGCLSVPDLFHLIREFVKGYGPAICLRLRQARQALKAARERLEQGQNHDPKSAVGLQTQREVEACQAEVERWEGIRHTYRDHLMRLSLMVHPWQIEEARPQSSQQVKQRLEAEIEAIETFMETTGLPMKKQMLEKVRKQLADVSALVDLWWQEVHDSAQSQVILTPMWHQWIDTVLLPLMYWQAQVSRTREPRRKAELVKALQASQGAFEAHALTQYLAPELIEGWKQWAMEHVRAFQRASSAVEGRNGYLSQMQHNHRGLPKRRYQVWSALYNFDCHAADRSTPASRFFRHNFPDLFEAVLAQIDELPRPRERRQSKVLTV